MRYLVVGLITLGIALLLLLAMPWSISQRAEDQQCRVRLRKLGLAVNEWVSDHGHERFPPITNLPEGQPWRPDRPGSADQVLWPYLYGTVPRRPRPGETEEDFLARFRASALTICPLTDRPYWYNESLAQLRPTDLAEGRPEAVTYFQIPRPTDGRWPARDEEGRPAAHLVVGTAIHEQVTAEQVATLRAKVAEEQARAPDSEELSVWRRRLVMYERQLAGAGGETFSMARLVAEVRTEARD